MLATEPKQSSFGRGLYQPNPEDPPPDGLQRCFNAWINDAGDLTTRPGPVILGPDQYAQPRGGIRFRPTGMPEQWIVIAGNDAIMSTDQWQTTSVIGAGLFPGTSFVTFTTMRIDANSVIGGPVRNALFVAFGGPLMMWDGSTWTNLNTVAGIPDDERPPMGLRFVATFNSRLWAAGHDGNQTVASETENPLNWIAPPGIERPVETYDGDEEITGLQPVGTVLLAFKENSTSYIDGFGDSDIIVAAGARGAGKSIGCIAFRTVVPIGMGSVGWLSTRGLEYWSPGREIEPLSAAINPFLIGNIDHARILATPGLPDGEYEPHRRIVVWSLPLVGDMGDVSVVWRLPKPEVRLPASFSIFTETETGGTRGLFMGELNGRESLLRLRGLGDVVEFDAVDTVMGSPGLPPPELDIVTRPEWYDLPSRRKRSRLGRVVVGSLTGNDAEIGITSYVDDAERGTEKLRTVPGTREITAKARVNGRGYAHALRIRTTDKIRIRGVSLAGEELREALPA